MAKKIIVILILSILLIGFIIFAYFGFSYVTSTGVFASVHAHDVAIQLLEAQFIDENIELSSEIGLDIWDHITPIQIELLYQVMVLPWGKSNMSPLTVKAFHNKQDIYIYFKWNDATEDSTHELNNFSDATAIMFPMSDKVNQSTLMMGFMGKANIWHWKAVQDAEFWHDIQFVNEAYSDYTYPFEDEEVLSVSMQAYESAVIDLVAVRVGTLTQKDNQIVSGRGIWQDGVWQVVMKRSLNIDNPDPDSDVAFLMDQKQLCAFAVWNGSNGDRGGRKSISEWVVLEVKN